MKSPCETRVNVNPLKSGRYFPNGNSGGGWKIKGTAEIKMEKQRSPPCCERDCHLSLFICKQWKAISLGIQSFCSALPRQDLEVSLSALPLWDIACVIDLVKQSGSFIKKQYSFVNVPTVFCFLFAPAQQHVPPGLCRFYILCLFLCFCFLLIFMCFWCNVLFVWFSLIHGAWSTMFVLPTS